MLTQQQLEERLKYITGSDAAVICGLSPYKTKVRLWMEKTGRVVQDDIGHLNHIKFGNYFEDGVARWFEAESGKPLCSEKSQLEIHKSIPWMAGNFDYLLEKENAILECKTAFKDEGWGEPGTDQIPAHYLMQVAHYCAVGSFARAYIAVVFAMTREMRWYQYDRNLALEGKLITREKEFWEKHILADVCPEPQTPQDVLALYKETKANPIIADKEMAHYVEEYAFYSEQVKQLKDMTQNAKEKIQMYMRDADTLVDNSGKILATWKYTKPIGRFDAAAFKKAHPDTYKTFYVEGSNGEDGEEDTRQRRFNAKGAKDE